ncbi:MAG TPA: ferrous iron transporter B [Phycisphaerales bacterium]|nr:ferrous iron transporter B [Phycisphaerales bacterium]HMP35839.1 ferrous iron transporter B [Phycisphaerales bacterium]
MTISADQATPDADSARRVRRVALVGNPNTGKTTLFNRLCGVRAKTANFPGSTVDARVGSCVRGGRMEIVDLPGTYSLDLDLPEARLCRDCIEGRLVACEPDAVLVVLDATNLRRNLQFAASVLRRGRPTVVALNMVDLAMRKGLSIDVDRLAARLGCPVVAISARSGRGIDALVAAVGQGKASAASLPEIGAATGAWADAVLEESVGGAEAVGDAHDSLTDRLDQAFTHPILGLVVFVAVMAGLFATIFWLADLPMSLIEAIFGRAGSLISEHLPAGALSELLADGIVAGISGVVIFLPQICLLFFLLSLLEDTGYLARASFVMDRIMARFGLPGQSFVPLLSSHACALPGIMATRLIPDRNERLATILVAPFMSCSARIPVYVLLIGLLFGERPLVAGIAFAGCYLLGAIAALLSALVARRTILPGRSRPMVLELPSYKWPSLRTALWTTLDRAVLFLRNAGTVILAISIVMWWLSAYPRGDAPPAAEALRAEAALVADEAARAELETEADAMERRSRQAQSFAGRIGAAVQPLFAPLGADRQITVAILTSFLAREVFLGTMIVLVGMPEEEDHDRILDGVRAAVRDDGRPLFDDATAAALLVFFVLAMQCLPTVALVHRETGSWRWPLLQFAWMSGFAWLAAVATHAIVRALSAG